MGEAKRWRTGGHVPATYHDGLAWQTGGLPGSQLWVIATWRTSTPGARLELRPAEPRGSDPSELRLVLVDSRVPADGAPGARGDEDVDQLVEYTEEADFHYETVTFVDQGVTLAVAHPRDEVLHPSRWPWLP